MFESAEQLLLAQFDYGPSFLSQQHADIALLDTSQTECNKLLLDVCLLQPEPSNEQCSGAFSVKITQLEVEKKIKITYDIVGNHNACSVLGG